MIPTHEANAHRFDLDIPDRQPRARFGLMHRGKRRALLHGYSITSSAKASNVAGTVRTSTLAAVIRRSCYNKAPDLEHGFPRLLC